MYTDSGSPFKFLIRYNNFFVIRINLLWDYYYDFKYFPLITNLHNNRFSIPSIFCLAESMIYQPPKIIYGLLLLTIPKVLIGDIRYNQFDEN